MKTTIITFLLFVVFLSYWLLTLFMNLPDNFLKINFLEYEKIFSKIFHQKWALFAPPPKSNDRLYYIFLKDSLSSDKSVYEVLGIINQAKRDKYPFGEK